MCIALMADVENNFIFGKIKHIVKGDGQFHHSEVGREMTAVFHNISDYIFAELFAKGIELPDIHRLQLLSRYIFNHYFP